jgi:hypothetical protein
VEGTERLTMSEPAAGSIWVLPAALGYWLVCELDGARSQAAFFLCERICWSIWRIAAIRPGE